MAAKVVRVWKGYGTPEGVDSYCHDHFAGTLLPQLQALDGFLAATVLVRPLGDEQEVVVATTWASLDAVKQFAGDDYEQAVVEPVVSDLLTRFDREVRHFALAVSRSAVSWKR